MKNNVQVVDIQCSLISKKVLLFMSLLSICSFLSCGTTENVDDFKIKSGEAQLLLKSQLPEDVLKELPDVRRTYLDDSSYYVAVAIDNVKLANLSKSKAFVPVETLKEKPIFLYGKYKNKWQFFDSRGAEIPENSKFNGFETILVKRFDNMDSVWIGPIPQKPIKLKILLRGDNSTREELFPEFKIK